MQSISSTEMDGDGVGLGLRHLAFLHPVGQRESLEVEARI